MKSLPKIMGIVNVTPDSFSDGGSFLATDAAVSHGSQLAKQGADILDIGGESTRPNAESVSIDEELRRVLPVITGLKDCGKLISIDTRHAAVMEKAIEAGAGMINDVAALQDDGALRLAAQAGVPVCLMHMQGDPQTMQNAPRYDNVLDEIKSFLSNRIDLFLQSGGQERNVVIDPGIGFGKALEHNLLILNNTSYFKALGFPVLIGLSRKSFIEHIDNGAAPDHRLGGSLAGAISCAVQGVDILRVHDVQETVQALSVYNAIDNAA